MAAAAYTVRESVCVCVYMQLLQCRAALVLILLSLLFFFAAAAAAAAPLFLAADGLSRPRVRCFRNATTTQSTRTGREEEGSYVTYDTFAR
mgnify:CR=1 FL=1